MKTIAKTGLLAFVLLSGGLASTPAHAGRGARYSTIMSAIQSNNADVIASELERAERLVCGRCVEPVRALLDHPEYRVREVAAWWFARRPALKAELTTEALTRLQSGDTIRVRNAADVLGTFRHPQVLPAIQAALGRSDLGAEAKVALLRAVKTIADPRGEAIAQAGLREADPTVKVAAVHALWALRGTRGGQALAPLLTDADVDVRRQTTAVMGSLKAAELRGALEGLLASDADWIVRRNAAFALGTLGDAASRGALEAAAGGDASSMVRSVARASIRKLR